MRISRESDFEGQWDLVIELPQDWENRDSWRAQTKLRAPQNPGERSSDSTVDNQTCLWVSGSLWQRRGSTVACLGVSSCSGMCAGMSPFGGGLHYPTGREHSPTCQQEIGLKTYWAWPWPPEQDPVFPLSIRKLAGQTEWKPESEN